MPKVYHCTICGRRAMPLYKLSRVSGNEHIKAVDYVWCEKCRLPIHKKATSKRKTIRVKIGGSSKTYVIPVPAKVKLDRSPKKGVYIFSEEEFSSLRERVERNLGVRLREISVIISTASVGRLEETRLIHPDISIDNKPDKNGRYLMKELEFKKLIRKAMEEVL